MPKKAKLDEHGKMEEAEKVGAFEEKEQPAPSDTPVDGDVPVAPAVDAPVVPPVAPADEGKPEGGEGPVPAGA